MTAPEQRCYRHPNREALVRCTRCDRPICPDCMRPASVGFHCPDDVEQAARTVRAPRNAFGARLLAARPYVTIALVVANVAVYLYTGVQSVGGINDPGAFKPSSLFFHWQLVPQYVHDDADYYQLLTSAFLHVNLLHLGSNMLALIVIGPALESQLGHWRYAAVYFLAALGGGTAVYIFGNPLGPTVGASGAVFGLFGAALVLFRKLGLDLQWLIGIIALNFVLTFSITGISKLAHIGGFLAGMLAAAALNGLPQPRGRERSSARVSTGAQLAGLGGLAVLIALMVGVRTATW
jgi:membrane associated rhomboid family serine protease